MCQIHPFLLEDVEKNLRQVKLPPQNACRVMWNPWRISQLKLFYPQNLPGGHECIFRHPPISLIGFIGGLISAQIYNRSQPHFLVYSIRIFARQLVDGARSPPLINWMDHFASSNSSPQQSNQTVFEEIKTHIELQSHIARVSSGSEVKQHVYILKKVYYIHISLNFYMHTPVYMYT